ncbi:MAG TPA: CCA tRNA nucleotidyltransferase [Terriglobia bacterium]|nr:CCA tRNA nucleotidyltransferase [Terriglobia bacterium]
MNAKRQAATEIARQLRDAGYQAYLVGGCVRDLVMGREPADYDIATDATPDAVEKLYPESLMVGAQFGVVLVPREAGNVEVATFRSDGRYTDGRHPDEVRYSKTAQEDVRRRDFTINGLLLDPLAPEPATEGGRAAEAGVIDYVGGLADIQARRLRTIGNPLERFSEDRLRMMRGVRFAARFGFALDPAAIQAIRQLASQIHSTSAERIRDEMVKILTEGQARRGFELLDQTGLLEEVLPEVKAMQGVAQPPEFHPEGDVWTHTLMMLDSLSRDASGAPRLPTPTLALGVLLHDVGKPPTFSIRERIRFDNHMEVGAKIAEAILGRLRFPARQTERVAELVRHHLRFKDFPQMRRSTQMRFLRMDGFDEHLELHRLDCLASHGDLTNYQLARHLLEETPPEVVKPAPLLRGDDLIALGYSPGPRFKLILRAVEDAQLEGRISSREEALGLVAEQFPLP